MKKYGMVALMLAAADGSGWLGIIWSLVWLGVALVCFSESR